MRFFRKNTGAGPSPRESFPPRERTHCLLHLLHWQADSLPLAPPVDHQFGPHYIQIWTALLNPWLTAIWSPNWERVIGSTSTLQRRLQIAVSGALSCNPRLQTDFIITLHEKCSPGFPFTFLHLCFIS